MSQVWKVLGSLVERYDLIYQTGLFLELLLQDF